MCASSWRPVPKRTEAARRWGLPLRLIHWAMAALLLGLVVLGWGMTHIRTDLGTTFQLYQWHKSWGLVVLLLLALRLAARALSPRPPPPDRLARLAAATQGLLYGLMLALPVCGWLMAAASPLALPTRPFNLFTLPAPVGPDMLLFERLRLAHELLAYGLTALVALHVAAALKHHLIDRDDILRRMGF